MVSNSDRLKSAGTINFARTHKNRSHTTTLLCGVNHQKHTTASAQTNNPTNNPRSLQKWRPFALCSCQGINGVALTARNQLASPRSPPWR